MRKIQGRYKYFQRVLLATISTKITNDTSIQPNPFRRLSPTVSSPLQLGKATFAILPSQNVDVHSVQIWTLDSLFQPHCYYTFLKLWSGILIKLLTIFLVFCFTYPIRSYCSFSKINRFEAERQSRREIPLLPFCHT